jgi:4-diphosphocytidyl-2-C-methyl-D-erythritol kinase
MDVPFYFVGGTAFDTEATATLRSIQTAVSLHFVIVLPGFGVPTKDAYAGIDYAAIGSQQSKTEQMQRAFANSDADGVIASMHNDFEQSVFPAYPALQRIKLELLDKGCHASTMSGSGSTIVGIARDHEHACSIARELQYRTIIAASAHHPIGETPS